MGGKGERGGGGRVKEELERREEKRKCATKVSKRPQDEQIRRGKMKGAGS